MVWNRMRRIGPVVLAVVLCLAPLTAAEAGGVPFGSSRMVASPSVLGWVGQLWQRMLSTWGQEGATIDPNGGNPPVNGNGSTTPLPIDRAWGEEGVSIDPSGGNPPINGNGSTTPPPIDRSNG
jgi:hypothetical protein